MGTRQSPLAKIQAHAAIRSLEENLKSLKFEMILLSSPGDRDKKSELTTAPQDFFTKDLDDAVISGKIDCAIHSAKDLPEPMPEDLDWFWLPDSEDPRDVLIFPQGQTEKCAKPKSSKGTKAQRVESNLKSGIRIGVSSSRREEYCRKRFPKAKLSPVRGTIGERIAQLDEGKYDLLVMAAAGLLRLGLANRISEYIPLTDLPSPDGQGYLAITFRKNNRIFREIRRYFVKTVVFAGAGPGDPGLVTLETLNSIMNCDICLYDALIPNELLKHVPTKSISIYSGRRQGRPSNEHENIDILLAKFARQGKRIVRLKGGDPGIFGKLFEETRILDSLEIPYRIIPGVSSLNAIATSGILLTKRAGWRGFSVASPRKGGSSKYEEVSKEEMEAFPRIFFMGLSETANIAKSLIKQGCPSDKSAAIVLWAGNIEKEKIIRSSLQKFGECNVPIPDNDAPGIFIVGDLTCSENMLRSPGALKKRRILLTCSETLMDRAAREVLDYGGIPIRLPLIELSTSQEWLKVAQDYKQDACVSLSEFDWIILTSPSGVRIFIESLKTLKYDLRRLPKIMVCGPGTGDEFRKSGIFPDAEVKKNFCGKGLLDIAGNTFRKNDMILRLRSDMAGDDMAILLRNSGFKVIDKVLYENKFLKYDRLPDFDVCVFASSSAALSFFEMWGIKPLKNKLSVAIGEPTFKTMGKHKVKSEILVPEKALIKDSIRAIAGYFIDKKLKEMER